MAVCEHADMPFENERDDILFTICMGLMHCRISAKPERREHVQRAQVECVLENLERSGYTDHKDGRGPRGEAVKSAGETPIGAAAVRGLDGCTIAITLSLRDYIPI